MIVNHCADCGKEQHFRQECCENWDSCGCPKVWECPDTPCRCVEDGQLVVCGDCAGARTVAVSLTGDYSTETIVLKVTKAQEEILRTLAEKARETMRASTPITVRRATAGVMS